jgi:putative endonuclease
MQKGGFVYCMSNRKRGVIYTGVTANLIRRGWEHKEAIVPGFTKRYNLKLLVYYEIHGDIETAIAYEKKIKNLHRDKKIQIIERMNPEWIDLYPSLVA